MAIKVMRFTASLPKYSLIISEIINTTGQITTPALKSRLNLKFSIMGKPKGSKPKLRSRDHFGKQSIGNKNTR